MKPIVSNYKQTPHAHIDHSTGGKRFGEDKKHRKNYKRGRSSIYCRKMVNIDADLHKKDAFEEVREAKKRVNEIRAGSCGI